MNVRLQKIGNSNMVTIPKPIIKKRGLSVGTEFKIIEKEGSNEIILKPLSKERKSLLDIMGSLKAPKNFDIKEAIKFAKEAGYDR